VMDLLAGHLLLVTRDHNRTRGDLVLLRATKLPLEELF
jgi:hypothetical protein